MQVFLSLTGEHDAEQHLRSVGTRARDARPAFRAIADAWRASEKRLFASEGASGGHPWPPLEASTIARRLGPRESSTGQHRHRSGRFHTAGSIRILDDTGALKASLTNKHDRHHVEDIDHNGLTFGTTVPYAGFLQTGTSRMKARPPVQQSLAERREATRILRRYILTGRVP